MNNLLLASALVAMQAAEPVSTTRSAATSESQVAPPSTALSLKIQGGLHGKVDAKARGVEVRVVLEQLKAFIKTPIHASPLVMRHKVDLSLEAAPVSTLLQILAPIVLVDLEIAGNRDDALWTAIHLMAHNESQPRPPLQQVGVLLAAGITDEEPLTPEAQEERRAKATEAELANDAEKAKPVLTVLVKDGLVSLRAQKQVLPALLKEVALQAGVPFDIRGTTVDMNPIDIEIRNLPLADLPVALGRSGIRVLVRRNLTTGDEIPQGIVLTAPQ